MRAEEGELGAVRSDGAQNPPRTSTRSGAARNTSTHPPGGAGRQAPRRPWARGPLAVVVGRSTQDTGGELVACKMGCGFVARQGFASNGRPFDTCCAGCAAGQQHDETCAQLPTEGLIAPTSDAEAQVIPVTNHGADADAEVAYRLQMTEMAGGGQPPAQHATTVPNDAALAQALQVEELNKAERARAARQQRRQQRERQRQEASTAEYYPDEDIWEAYDMVWGSLRLTAFHGPLAQSRAALAIECCPCFLIGCGAKAQRAYSRFFLSFSFFTGFVQVLLMVGAIIEEGGLIDIKHNVWLGPHFVVLNDLGAKNTALILHDGHWWRLFTPILLHAGIIHLICNLAMQMSHSVKLEVMFGSFRWLVIYFGSGIYGTMASCVVVPNALSVGSSGALCGLLGAWLVFIAMTWQQTSPSDLEFRKMESRRVLIAALVIGGLSFLPLLDLGAHLGGMVMGAILAILAFAHCMQDLRWRIGAYVVGVFLFVAVMGVTVVYLLVVTDPNEDLRDLCRAPEDVDCGTFQSCFQRCEA
mmetsp:Transcript_34749/g.63480  ORF Transcript_34749/g.63480 Transcript_34749/m.63480 type:complete len:529 (-) Transcript_34749:84-1670(-)